MPKRGHPLTPPQQARHAAALAAPLRVIVGSVQTGTFGDGRPIYHEALACGHTGDGTTQDQAAALAARGVRRRCRQCQAGPEPAPGREGEGDV